MNLGILYPRSSRHPGIAIDFLDGLKTFLKKGGMDKNIRLFTESIGFGGAEKEVYQKTERLIMDSNTDVLVAFIDLKVLSILEPLLYASGKLMIVVNPGANYPQNWVPQPNIVYLTLHHAFLCWLTGSLAAKNNVARAAVATSLYDCGYLHSAAIVKNFTRSGGSVTFNYINKQPYDPTFHVDELISFLSTGDTENVLCVFDELPASLFYNRLSKFNHSGMHHLFVSPMMLESKALGGLDKEFAFSIEGYVPWLPLLDNPANHVFAEVYLSCTGRNANIFSLLGWETGLILEQVLGHNHKDYSNGEAIANQLQDTEIGGPRGNLKLDPETHYFLSPAVRCSVNKNAGLDIEEIKHASEEWISFVSEPSEGISSGWTNTYLCY